jgi:Protein of unknown function (DUF2958)
MKLMTAELKRRIPRSQANTEIEDQIVFAHFFTPWSNWSWYVLEFDGIDTFYGYVVGFEKEFGYFSLSELERGRGPGGLRIERDMYWRPTRVGDLPEWDGI